MISVVILSKTASNVIPCVEAIEKHDPEADVIIVDDGIESEGYARLFALRVGAIVNGEKPFVYSRNANLGLREAFSYSPCRGAFLLNDDAILETPGGFTALAAAADEHPEYGLIGAVTNVTGQPLQFRQNIGLREVPHFAFVCAYIPRSTFDRIGGLDERFCLDYGCEDRDYCESVRHAGLKVGVFDHCYVDHGSLTSTYRGDPHAPKSFARNFELLKAKWGTIAP